MSYQKVEIQFNGQPLTIETGKMARQAHGAVVVTYNLPGVPKGLKLNSEDVANIFLGKITKWNDKAIADLNAGADAPDARELPGTDLGRLFLKGMSDNSPKEAVQRHALASARLIEVFSGRSKMMPGSLPWAISPSRISSIFLATIFRTWSPTSWP